VECSRSLFDCTIFFLRRLGGSWRNGWQVTCRNRRRSTTVDRRASCRCTGCWWNRGRGSCWSWITFWNSWQDAGRDWRRNLGQRPDRSWNSRSCWNGRGYWNGWGGRFSGWQHRRRFGRRRSAGSVPLFIQFALLVLVQRQRSRRRWPAHHGGTRRSWLNSRFVNT
jgi:hypothetical protein